MSMPQFSLRALMGKAWFAVALAMVGSSAVSPSWANDAPSIGQVAPEIEGEDLDGVRFKLSDYRGKVVVLDFWGDW